jgi:hypothetical protein
MNAVPVKDLLQEPVKGLRPACSVGPVAASRGHGNERLLRRYSLKGYRHDVVTREHPSGGLGQVRVGVSPKANGWLDCRHQAGRAHGNGRWRSGRNYLASWIRNNRVGDHVGKVLGFPAAVVPSRNQLERPPDAFYVEETTTARGGRKRDGLQVVGCSAAQHAEHKQRASQRGKESFKIHRRVPPIGNLPHRRSIRDTRQGNQSHCTART